MAEAQGNNGSGENQNKTFTQEEVNAIIGERLARQAEKYADYDDLKTKAAECDKQQEESKTELQKAQEKSAKLQEKVDRMEKAGKIRDIRDKVSHDTGVPVELLTGEDEESCSKQAANILKFAKGSKYPGVKEVKDEGKNKGPSSETTGEFKELAEQIFGRKD